MEEKNTPKELTKKQILGYIKKLSKIDIKKAQAKILHYISQNKDDTEAYLVYAEISKQAKDIDSAIPPYLILTKSNESYFRIKAKTELGIIFKNQGKMQEAKYYLQSAIEDNPKEAKQAILVLAAIYRKENDLNKALALFQKLEEHSNTVKEEMAIILSKLGKKQEALQELEKIELTPSGIYNRYIALEKAKLATTLKDFTLAEKYLLMAKKTRKKDKIYYQAIMQEAILALAKQNFLEAKEICENLLAEGQNISGDINVILGEAYVGLEDYANAINNYNIAINITQDETIKSSAYALLGDLAFKMGDFDKAIENYTLCNPAKMSPNLYEKMFFVLISIYIKQEKYLEADDMVKKYCEHFKDIKNSERIRRIELLIAKKTGAPLPKRIGSYVENQIIEYRERDAINHIKDKHKKEGENASNFSPSINIDILFNKVKFDMILENMVYEDLFDIYIIDHPNVGYNLEGQLVDQIAVITIPGTKNIITMYPTNKAKYKRNSSMSSNLASQQKVKSKQIDRFNARLAKTQKKDNN